ncbi:MAG: ferrous iron transporter B, partial [Verrucomicrobiota bacterium]|nr:ferrous iron transporter B [Verrucomicrobiota bacterium]
MVTKIALAGNPNCGKTTLFNDLTGSAQYVGNWPGVTVEKKDGVLLGRKKVVIQDLPGIYSLSPYSLEEVVARNYLVNERPDAILNIVDGSNLERNLYLTTQLLELGIPMVVAVNMIDVVRKNGDRIDMAKLSKALGCAVVEISALKGEGTKKAADMAIEAAEKGVQGERPHVFTGSVEHAIAHIEESLHGKVEKATSRWAAIKVFERDAKAIETLSVPADIVSHVEGHIKDCEKEMEDDSESIITTQRYEYIQRIVAGTYRRSPRRASTTLSDRIDKIVTNRILALPIFILSLCAMWWLAVADGGPG